MIFAIVSASDVGLGMSSGSADRPLTYLVSARTIAARTVRVILSCLTSTSITSIAVGSRTAGSSPPRGGSTSGCADASATATGTRSVTVGSRNRGTGRCLGSGSRA